MLLRFALAGSLALAASVASAEIVTIRYNFPSRAGVAFTYGYFGADRGPTTGTILSTTLVVNYTTTDDLDAADFYLTFDVPVTGAQQEHIGLTGTDLGWSGLGTFEYSFTNDLYNGTIREGRFGAEFNGQGTLTDSYVEFVVDADPIDPIYADSFEEL
ncbi:MAG: hypothetical protein ABIR62_10490 [Dokdonella sp.]|uniref:hypothetical protein n=1 Tax=Dokdonella sp. TaxID=2291710 RepID=UPI003263E489